MMHFRWCPQIQSGDKQLWWVCIFLCCCFLSFTFWRVTPVGVCSYNQCDHYCRQAACKWFAVSLTNTKSSIKLRLKSGPFESDSLRVNRYCSLRQGLKLCPENVSAVRKQSGPMSVCGSESWSGVERPWIMSASRSAVKMPAWAIFHRGGKRRSSPRTGLQSVGKSHTDARAGLISFTRYVLDLTLHMSKTQSR